MKQDNISIIGVDYDYEHPSTRSGSADERPSTSSGSPDEDEGENIEFRDDRLGLGERALLMLIVLIILGLGIVGTIRAESPALPPPPAAERPVPALPPPVDLALLKLDSAAPAPEEIWSDTMAAAIRPSSAIPAPVDGDAAPAVRDVLESIRQDAPRAATLEAMLFEQLRAAMPAGSDGYIFEKAIMNGNLALPAGVWTVHYDFRLPPRGIGAALFTATVSGDRGKILRRFGGSVAIDREASGIQVTRVLRKGETVGRADIRQLGTRLSLLPRGAFDDARLIENMVARQELRPGQWLTEQMIDAPLLVKRGGAVTIRLTRGPIEIVVPGIVRQDGARGEVIRVENTQSRREIYARVVSSEEVQVIF